MLVRRMPLGDPGPGKGIYVPGLPVPRLLSVTAVKLAGWSSHYTVSHGDFMENEILRTKCQSIVDGRKYSVNCIKSWREKNNLELLSPNYGEMLIFSSHLIHGLGINNNFDETRISLEVSLHHN